MRIFGAREVADEIQRGGLCSGCGACVDLCPYFRSHRGRTVQVFPCTLAQGRCYAACPKAEVDLDELAGIYWGRPYEGSPLGRYDASFAARAGLKMPAGRYQGGGTVSALLVQAMSRGMIDAAVLTGRDESGPLPVLAESPGEVIACASSKFGAAPTLAALNRAADAGRRNLGVVGTPCQITALAKMRGNLLHRDDFVDPVSLTIGLFCNWSLDSRAFGAYLAGLLPDPSRIRAIDIPPPPANVMRLDLGDDAVEVSLDEIRPLIPATCGLCPDMTSEWADLSVGMYEGRPGWNMLLVRTARGRELVESAVASGLLTTEAAVDLEHLSAAAAAKKRRAFQAMKERGLVNPPDETARAMLRVAAEVLSKIIDGGSHA